MSTVRERFDAALNAHMIDKENPELKTALIAAGRELLDSWPDFPLTDIRGRLKNSLQRNIEKMAAEDLGFLVKRVADDPRPPA